MARYVVRRLAGLLFTFLVVSIITFSLMHAVPGGPFDENKQPLPPAAKANILHKYGLDQPVWKQYLLYMRAAIHFDFGIAYQSPTETVATLIGRVWPATLQLAVLVIGIAYVFGLLAGILAAINQNSWIDRTVTTLATMGFAVPNFVIAVWLILIFSVTLHWLPTGGWGTFKQLIMPALVYAAAPLSLVARYTRVSMLESMRADYVRTARAKGMSERTIILRHILKNALLPLITVLGPQIPNIATGSIFIESVFRINGLGRYFVTSTFNRDYPMIMATILLVALLWGVTYLLSDILYTVVDPRVRLAGQESTVSTSGFAELQPKAAAQRTLWRNAARSFSGNRLAMAGLVVVAVLIICAVCAELIAPFKYTHSNLAENLQYPSATHPFGTDPIGRDLLSRIIYGVRTSLIVGFAVVGLGFLIGFPLGAIAGLRGGWVDFVVTRMFEIMTAFPGFLFAIFLMSILGGGMINVIIALSVSSWVDPCRLTRAQILSLREREFVMAARSYGAGDLRVVFRHVLPHALPPLVIMVALGIPNAIFAEAGLSFLGVGINDPLPSLGKMVSTSMGYLSEYWYMGIFPTVTIALAMLGFNFVGDGLRDALDPTTYNMLRGVRANRRPAARNWALHRAALNLRETTKITFKEE